MREFNTREAEGNYSITFETDDRKAFEKVQELCRILIDGKEVKAIQVDFIWKWVLAHYPFTTDTLESITMMLKDWAILEDWEAEKWES